MVNGWLFNRGDSRVERTILFGKGYQCHHNVLIIIWRICAWLKLFHGWYFKLKLKSIEQNKGSEIRIYGHKNSPHNCNLFRAIQNSRPDIMWEVKIGTEQSIVMICNDLQLFRKGLFQNWSKTNDFEKHQRKYNLVGLES